MSTLYTKLEALLRTDERFVSHDGKLMRNAVYEASNMMDDNLLRLLMSDSTVRDAFFRGINGVLVFDKQEFNYVVNNKKLLPDSYTRYREKIGLVDSKGDFLTSREDVALSFPFKDCVLEFDSTDPDEKRKEIYFNETLERNKVDHLFEKKVLTNMKKYDGEGEHSVTEYDEADNLLIKGNNLLALYSLLPRYEGRIKLMYWDVLYNTASDEVPYADRFKHSTWLVMMKNRLEVANRLLSPDGLICIQCDDNEVARLYCLMAEIFKPEDNLKLVCVKMSEATGVKMASVNKAGSIAKLKEFIILAKKDGIKNLFVERVPKEKWDNEYKTYVKNITDEQLAKIKYIIDDEERTEDDVKYVDECLKQIEFINVNSVIKEELGENISEEKKEEWCYRNASRIIRTVSIEGGAFEIAKSKLQERSDYSAFSITTSKKKMYFIKGGFNTETNSPRCKILFADMYLTVHVGDLWTDIKTTGLDSEGGIALNHGKKPERLIQRVIKLNSKEGDVVLDAYLGSGTTAAVAMKMKRRFIGIEQLDSHVEKSLVRLGNVINGDSTGISQMVNWQGGGSFVYCELKKLNQNFADEIAEAMTKEELLDIADRMMATGFVSCYVKAEDIKKDELAQLTIEDIKKILLELLDKNQLYVNYSDRDDEEMEVTEEEKRFSSSFYGA